MESIKLEVSENELLGKLALTHDLMRMFYNYYENVPMEIRSENFTKERLQVDENHHLIFNNKYRNFTYTLYENDKEIFSAKQYEDHYGAGIIKINEKRDVKTSEKEVNEILEKFDLIGIGYEISSIVAKFIKNIEGNRIPSRNIYKVGEYGTILCMKKSDSPSFPYELSIVFPDVEPNQSYNSINLIKNDEFRNMLVNDKSGIFDKYSLGYGYIFKAKGKKDAVEKKIQAFYEIIENIQGSLAQDKEFIVFKKELQALKPTIDKTLNEEISRKKKVSI